MKRLLAFALIAAIGMFTIGCGGSKSATDGPPKPGAFGTSADKTKTPAAPGAADKKP
jgi:hypothetical protein